MERIWTFKTPNFTIELACENERDPDLSWADEETIDKLDRGIYVNVTFRVRVLYRGAVLSETYLGNSTYEDVRTFRDHIGSRGQWGSSFTDMVREACNEARKAICTAPKLRCA